MQYLTPHPIKGKAAGRKVVMVPLILFSDDTSGNRSKKWHKFESYYLLLAGLPRKENMQHVNIHFICTSDSATPLEMAEPAVILLSSNTFATYVTLALLRKAISRLAVCNLLIK